MALACWFLLTMTFTGCQCNSLWKLFHKEPGFADRMCPSGQFEFQTVSKNALWCVRECAEKIECRSLIYLHDNNSCYGIRSDYPFSTYSSLPGAVFYRADNLQSTILSTTSSAATEAITRQPTTTTKLTTSSTTSATISAPSTAKSTIDTTSSPTTTTTISTTMTPSASTTSISSSSLTTSLTTEYTTTTTTATANILEPTIATVSSLTGPGTGAVAGLQDSQFAASSVYTTHYAWNAKLDNTASSWVPATHDEAQWIQVDFGTNILATHVITKGSVNFYYWTAEYKVLTSTDCTAFAVKTDDNGKDKIFIGNADSITNVTNALEPSVVCRCLRINPLVGNPGYMGLRFDVLVHNITTGSPIVAVLPDSRLTASNNATIGYEAWQARLDNTVSCWRLGVPNQDQWIQVDFVNQTLVTHIITKGNPNNASWVMTYKVLTSTDCGTWVVVKDNAGMEREYDGNTDGDTVVQNALDPPVIGRCFRINPVFAINSGCLRVDVLTHEI